LWASADGSVRTLLGIGLADATIAFSPDGDMIAIGTQHSDVVQLLRVPSGDRIADLSGNTGGVASLAFARGKPLLAVATSAQQVHVWNLETKKRAQEMTVGIGSYDVVMSNDGA